MAGNRTLAIVKPDAFGSSKAGKILAHIEAAQDLSIEQELRQSINDALELLSAELFG